MTRKLKIAFAVVPIAISAITLSVAMTSGNKITNLQAADSNYQLTLNSTNSLSGLTSSYQRTVSGIVTTNLGNEITVTITNGKTLSNGFVQLGNFGAVYCITSDSKHVSGLTSIYVDYSGGSLKLKSSSVDTTDGSSYITETSTIVTRTTKTLSTPANSFVLEAQDEEVSISSIRLNYSCSTSSSSYNFNAVHDVESFESYTETGVGYDANHSVGTATGLRAAYYSTYYGAGTDPLNGSGWTIMGSSDYLTYNSSKGMNNSKCGLFKSNNGNYFHYAQSKYYFGIPTAIGKGAKLSVWMHGAYADTSMSSESSYDAEVTLIAYYDKILNKSGTNNAATRTYNVEAHSDWTEYTVDLDTTKTVYAYGIHIKLASGTIYVPVDDVKIYTTTPYSPIAVTGVQMSSSTLALTTGSTATLVATIKPTSAANKSVTWTSSNSSVATVNSSGVVTGIAAGTATITVTTVDGGYTATCTVTVSQAYPGGSYFTTVSVSNYNIKIEVVCSTRQEVKIWFYGYATEGARFTSYNASTGAFVIQIDGSVTIQYVGTKTYGNMTGYYRNNQLENVALTGSVGDLLGNTNGNINIPHPTSYYWDCDGTTSQLQNTFKRRWRNGSSWAYDNDNSDRIVANTTNRSSGTNGVQVRGYSSGVGIVLASAISGGISTSTANTFCMWVYNPDTVKVTFRFFLYKNTDLTSNFEPVGGREVAAQSWYYLRIGYGDNSSAGTVYNLMVTNLDSGSSSPFVIDDIWFHG